jgi:hypothetical protein
MVSQKSVKIAASVLRGEIGSFCWFLDLRYGAGLITLLKGGTKVMILEEIKYRGWLFKGRNAVERVALVE